MIHGYIIKKIGEDIYLEFTYKGSWEFTKFPFIFTDEATALDSAKEFENVEVKRADIFITP